MNILTQKSVTRVGKIDFLNTLPFFHSWDSSNGQSGIRFVEGYPQQINEKMRNGEIDLGLTSSLFYARHFQDLFVLPSLCIGAYRRSRSVTLYSSKPIESLDGARIGLSAKSLSASSLLKILLKLRWGFENVFEESLLPPEQMLSCYNACLLIGDEALFFRPPGLFAYDLSEIWWQWTGYPFCFALWTVRKSFFEGHVSETKAVFESLERNLVRNLGDIENIVQTSQVPSFQKTLVAEYLRSLEYRLPEKIKTGLLLFFDYAQKIGLVSSSVPLNFCPFF